MYNTLPIKAYCINLDSRDDRWQECIGNYREAGIPDGFISKFSAVRVPDFGVLGCVKSHVKVLAEFLSQETADFCLVLEDDFDFQVSFQDLLHRIIKASAHLRNEWDVFLLAGTFAVTLPDDSKNEVERLLEAQTTSAYLIQRKYVPSLLACFSATIPLMEKMYSPSSRGFLTSRLALDVVWKQLQIKDRWFIFSPTCGCQRVSFSDIEGRVVDYTKVHYNPPKTAQSGSPAADEIAIESVKNIGATIQIEGLEIKLDLLATVVRDLSVREYFARGGDQRYLYGFKLNENSIVVDVGAHTGVWAERMGGVSSRVYLIEPIKAFQATLREKFAGMSNVTVVPYGVGRSGECKMKLDGDSTSAFSVTESTDSAETEVVRMEPFEVFLRDFRITSVDVLQINVEGAEYDLLENIIETGLIKIVSHLQVQFHPVTEECVARRYRIRKELALTHREVCNFPFVWEIWTKR